MMSDETFLSERNRIRNEDIALKDRTNLFHDLAHIHFGPSNLEAWFNNGVYLKIHDDPGTLSGNILRLLDNAPTLRTHSEIIGNDISEIAYREIPAENSDWDANQDATDEVARLPIVSFDPTRHFAKECRRNTEVVNLLKAKGSPHTIVELLGRTEDGKLVFPLYVTNPSVFFLTRTTGISEYGRLLLQLADAVIFLHSQGIIHRDLALRNILASHDRKHLILCDLESRFDSHFCPEIALATERGLPESEIPYSEKSDVLCFGTTVADFILCNTVRTSWQYSGNFVPPAPFDEIVRACIKPEPADRPNMREVRQMLELIAGSGSNVV